MLTALLISAAVAAGPEAVTVTVYGDTTCAQARVSMLLGPEDTCVEGNDADVPPGVNPNTVSRVSTNVDTGLRIVH